MDKLERARLVVGSVTTSEYLVLFVFFLSVPFFIAFHFCSPDPFFPPFGGSLLPLTLWYHVLERLGCIKSIGNGPIDGILEVRCM